MDPGGLPAGDGQLARHARAGGEHDRVEAGAQLLDGQRALAGPADVDAGAEAGALLAHLGEATVDVSLLELELGDAVAQQPAEAVVLLEHDHGVAGAGELLGGGEARRSGADDRDGATGVPGRGDRAHPALLEGAVDDRDLDVLDRHRRLVDAQHAAGLAGGGAGAAGELGEVVGRVEALGGLLPVVAVDQVVPLRDQVAQRAALVAEGDAAVHAAPGLAGDHREGALLAGLVDLAPVHQAHRDRAAGGQLAVAGAQESSGISHGWPP